MFQTLLESRASRARRTSGAAVSIGVHTTAIALVIAATAHATAAPPEHTLEPSDIFWAPAPATPRLPVAQHMARAPIKWALPPISEHVWAPVQPIDFPELNLSADPTGDLANHAFDGAKPLAPCFCGQGADGSSGTEGGLYTEPMVDKAAMPRPGNPSPTYPAVLRAAQLEGSVTAHFIVDTLGRAEPASIAFPEASHPAFAEAVRQSLLRSRYLPAIVAGHPVRQLVEQRFTFALQH